MQVIQGAPGANGPVLDHYNQVAVKNYLSHISRAISEKLGPMSPQIRAFFCDSLELEGANWCEDMVACNLFIAATISAKGFTKRQMHI